MIRIVMTLISGVTGKHASLGEAEIVNIGEDADAGRYRFRILKGAAYAKNPRGTWKSNIVSIHAAPDVREAEMKGFPRRSRKLGPWDLLRSCLDVTLAGRDIGMVEGTPRRPVLEQIEESALGDIMASMAGMGRPDVALHAFGAMAGAIAARFGIDRRRALALIEKGMDECG